MNYRGSIVIAVATSLGVVAFGCTRTSSTSSTGSTGATTDASPPPATSAIASVEPGSDEIKPVYPVDAGPPNPLAQQYCDAIAGEPERAKASCCGTSSAATMLIVGQCVRTLTAALATKAVTLAPADVQRCADAVKQATTGCDWVTPTALAMPPVCEGIIKGTAALHAECRSSLECAAGLRCQGLSSIDVGKCEGPKATRAPCNLASDMLASFTRQDTLARTHPECAGYCVGRTCKDATPVGDECASDVQCGRGFCVAGKCSAAAPPSLGSSCTGGCSYGLACVDGKCVAKRAEGAACDANGECRGACVRPDGGTSGTCSKTCPTFSFPRAPKSAASAR